jgi:cysteine synthase
MPERSALRPYWQVRKRPAIGEEGIVSVISVPQAFNEDELYVDLQPIFGHSLFLKCEGFNFAGSIKLKAASEMVEAADRQGVLDPNRSWLSPPRETWVWR